MNELYHFNKNHDRLGRFASGPSGSLTSASVTSGESTSSARKRSRQEASGRAFTPGKDGKPSPSEKLMRGVEGGVDSSRYVVKGVRGIKGKEVPDTARMTDDELRTAINRLKMEQQYSDLYKSQLTDGQERVDNILATAGGIAAIGVSAATIATAIYTIRGKR